MQSVKMRRKVAASAAENGDSADKLDQLLLSAAVCNGEDLGPFIRKAFASGKPETLVHHLRHFTRSKESEIEDVCKAHYQDFIMAVDDLRSLLSDVDSLKSSLSNSNTQLQSVAGPLLTSLDSFVEARNKCLNITLANLQALGFEDLPNMCSINGALLPSKSSYLAKQLLHGLKVSGIDRLIFSTERRHPTLQRMFEKQISAIRSHIERRINKEFGVWLVDIRIVSQNLGQLAIGQALASRQREEEMHMKQRQAEEQSQLSLRDCIYALEEEYDEGFT